MSGEHGDGLVHTPRLQEMYGEEIYALFTRIKNAFDPQGVMNPGKKVGPQEPAGTLFRDVRYGPGYRTLPQKPLLHFPDRGYESEIERCHGCASARARSPPRCAPPTRPPGASTPRPGPRPTCCGASSPARSTRRAPTG